MALLYFRFVTQKQRGIAFEQRSADFAVTYRCQALHKLNRFMLCGNDTNGLLISYLEEGRGGHRIEIRPPLHPACRLLAFGGGMLSDIRYFIHRL